MDTLKKLTLYFGLMATILFTLIIDSCTSDDAQIQRELDELMILIESLDDWSKKANSQITALEGLVHALEQNHYITDVTPIMEGSKEIGYTISFNNRTPIHIYNGEDGKDGIVPIIGVRKATNRNFYWTVQIGTAPVEYILDAAGQRVPVTGEEGVAGPAGTTPTITVAIYDGSDKAFTDKLCWKVNGAFLLSNGDPVVARGVAGSTGATGPQGDAIFKENGIKIDQVNGTVTFTLADGVTTITLPLVSKLKISIAGGNGVKEIYQPSHQFTINGEGDYTAIKAEITSGAGIASDVIIAKTNTNSSPWSVKIGTKVDGPNNTWSSIVTVNRYIIPASEYLNSNQAILKISITDERGNEISTSAPLEILTVTIAAIGNLKTAINALVPLTLADIKFLKINGTISNSDFSYLALLFKGTLLDLSEATVEENIFPYDIFTNNTILESIIFPKNISIGSSAFSGCTSLSSVEMSSITSLEYSVFAGCTALTSVNLPIATVISQHAFSDCTSLSLINIPRVTVIGVDAFYNTNFTEISFYNLKSTTFLNPNAFSDSKITTIKVYNSTSAFIQTFNDWLDINFSTATAVAGI